MKRRIVAAVAAALSVSLLAACAPADPIVEGSVVSVATAQSLTSLNPHSRYGATVGNEMIAAATSTGFGYYDEQGAFVEDESFGRAEIVSTSPFTVRYTVADGVRWSDGSAIDAADLLLEWVAASGARTTPDVDRAQYVDPATGAFVGELPAGTVYFDTPPRFGETTATPEMSDDRKSVTVTWDAPFADWQTAFWSADGAGMPAHVVAQGALGTATSAEGKNAVIAAVLDGDDSALSRLSQVWNAGFDLADIATDADALVSSGPYAVSDFVSGQRVTLTASDDYEGEREAHISEVVVRVLADPLAAVQAISSGAVDVIDVRPDTAVLEVLGVVGVTSRGFTEASGDRLDLRVDQARNPAFADPRVREAFLKVIPRRELVEQIVSPSVRGVEPRDSHVFLPGSEEYGESVATNGSADFADVDVEGAAALLAEAGVSEVEVCVLYSVNNDRLAREFAAIQQSAALAGFAVVDCSSENWSERLAVPGEWDAALLASTQTAVSATDIGARYLTGSPQNTSFYSNAEVDALVAALQTETDRDARVELETQLDAVLWRDRVGIPLLQAPALIAVDRTRVTGVSRSPFTAGLLWNVWAWES